MLTAGPVQHLADGAANALWFPACRQQAHFGLLTGPVSKPDARLHPDKSDGLVLELPRLNEIERVL